MKVNWWKLPKIGQRPLLASKMTTKALSVLGPNYPEG